MNAAARVCSTCPYCGVGCGVIAQRDPEGAITIQGDPEHPANKGRLCSKGSALGETLDLEGRLLHPEINKERADWDSALDLVADKFKKVIDEHGPDAVAFYVSGQLLTEDYYVANKLMKGFIGSANIDTNSRLCMASAVAAYKRAFGSDTVPCDYFDLDHAELFVLVGSNTAWCHPVIYQRMLETRNNNKAKIVVIDPRVTSTCEEADLHLPVKPGTDVMLFNGLLHYLRREDCLDLSFIESHTEGFAATFTAAKADAPTIPVVASTCGLEEKQVAEFYRLFARNEKTLTLFSQGVNQSSSGTDKANAIINCHLATGRIGKPGAGPFSLTGQPNAMGGREVGGLANQLAAHMELGDAGHRNLVKIFWNSPGVASKPGLKAVDLFDAVAQKKVKALWIMATNPAVSLPNADRVRAAIAGCEFVVVSDCVRDTDTNELADVLLPALAWGEKDGTVTNSERRISRQRAFLPAPGEARPDWWIITQVARRMGFENEFAYEFPYQVFNEHALLSGFHNNGSRDFDISSCYVKNQEEYDSFQPRCWPPAHEDGAKLFSDGHFYRPGGKAALVPVSFRVPTNATSDNYPLVLNTGRVRDQWHTMTRTGRVPRLMRHRHEPKAEIHPDDARRIGLVYGDLVQLNSDWGEAVARVDVTHSQRPGNVFLPMHWSARNTSAARADALVNPATDPVSGQPESKHTPVRIARYPVAWAGFLLSREELENPATDYWLKVQGEGHWRYEIAGSKLPDNWKHFALHALHAPDKDAQWVEFYDGRSGRYRAALLRGGHLQYCLFVAPSYRELPEFNWLSEKISETTLNAEDQSCLLAGKPADLPDTGPIVCSCFNVGRRALTDAISEQGLMSTDAIGESLRAGTNCGSCLPEIRALLKDRAAAIPA